jgi:hypothetical protein
MLTSSCKGKGRRGQQFVAKHLADHYGLVYGVDQDFASRPMGGSGVDVSMSPAARAVCPFDVEVKMQEKLNIWSALEQAKANTKEGRIPLLCFSRNRTDMYATLRFQDLLRIMK